MAFFDLPSDPARRTAPKKAAPKKAAPQKAAARKKAAVKKKAIKKKGVTKKIVVMKARVTKKDVRKPVKKAATKAPVRKKSTATARRKSTVSSPGKQRAWKPGIVTDYSGSQAQVEVLHPRAWLGVGVCAFQAGGEKRMCLLHMPSGGVIASTLITRGHKAREHFKEFAEHAESLTDWGSSRVKRAAKSVMSGKEPPDWFMSIGQRLKELPAWGRAHGLPGSAPPSLARPGRKKNPAGRRALTSEQSRVLKSLRVSPTGVRAVSMVWAVDEVAPRRGQSHNQAAYARARKVLDQLVRLGFATKESLGQGAVYYATQRQED